MTKVPKVCPDFAEGIGYLGQLISNAAELKADLALRHTLPSTDGLLDGISGIAGGVGQNYSIGTPSMSSNVGASMPGRHDSLMIARGLLVCFDSAVQWIDGSFSTLQFSSNAGQYFLPISGWSNYWAEVTPLVDVSDETTIRIAVATAQPGRIMVQTFQLGTRGYAGATGNFFNPWPFDFHIAVYGSNAPANPFVEPSRLESGDTDNATRLPAVQQQDQDDETKFV